MNFLAARPFAISIFLLLFAILPAVAQQDAPPANPPAQQGAPDNAPRAPRASVPPFKLMSPSFADGATIPAQYTCSAATPAPTGPRAMSTGVSPALQWVNPPKGTVSFVLLLHDPDARIARQPDDVTHWIVFNIPGDATQLPEGVKPDAPMADGTLQGKNMTGKAGFQGPCASGDNFHHYTFWLLALDEKLDLPAGATREDIEKAASGHVLANAAYIGLFHR